MVTFFRLLDERAKLIDSLLCVGLDPEPSALGENNCNKDGLISFCKRIVEATSHVTLIYKPNSAFFERFVCRLLHLNILSLGTGGYGGFERCD